MTEADRIFELFPDYIKEYIYSHSWQELRAGQVAAAHTILETDHNLLLTSSTASGKTEAAFFLDEKPCGIGKDAGIGKAGGLGKEGCPLLGI